MAGSSLGAAAFVWKFIDYTKNFFQIKEVAVTVLVIGAAGEIGYAIVPMIASGAMFGADQPVILHMLVTDDKEKKRVEMELIEELIDAAFPLLKRVVVTTVAKEACTGVHVAIIIVPRTEGEKRKEGKKTKEQAEALKNYAAEDCKVLVVANPANTIKPDWIKPSSKIPEKNITYLTRLEHNRALGQISVRVKVPVSDVKNVIIWGKINGTLRADVDHAIVTTSSGQKHPKVLVADDNWSQFIKTVLPRISDRNGSGAMTIAKSACDHVRDWLLGTPKGTWVSMGVYSDGSYGTTPGDICSFPVKCQNGEWSLEKVSSKV